VKKVVTGDQTDTIRYVWDGGELLEEIGAGRRYTPHPTDVDAILSVSDTHAAGSFYFHRDATGSVTRVTNSSGSTVTRYRYDAFGNRTVIGSEGYASPIRWQGREFDSATGLLYYRARYYAPQLGRFLSEDPIGIAGGPNVYLFAGNDPVNWSDPSGLSCVKPEDWPDCATIPGITVVVDRQQPWYMVFYDNFMEGFGDATSLHPIYRDTGPGYRTGALLGILSFAGAGRGGLAGGARPLITVDVAHNAKHLIRLKELGITAEVYEAAVRGEINSMIGTHGAGAFAAPGSFWGRVTIQGHQIEYRAHVVRRGYINVGTGGYLVNEI
jgi:RHS repeat-associated protein